MAVNYDKLDSDYISVRENIINYITNNYDFNVEIAKGIVDYENHNCKVNNTSYNQVKDLMEQDLLKDRPYSISSMAKQILKNDEGKYHLSK